VITILQGLTVLWFGASEPPAPGLSDFWCAMTGVSGMTSGGEVEELDDDD
jgi:hypothetical protein